MPEASSEEAIHCSPAHSRGRQKRAFARNVGISRLLTWDSPSRWKRLSATAGNAIGRTSRRPFRRNKLVAHHRDEFLSFYAERRCKLGPEAAVPSAFEGIIIM